MNRRVVYTRGGPPAEVLTVIEEPEPRAPGHGQVLIRTTAFPVHRGDLLAVETHPGTAAEPVPGGVEATGAVEAIGPGTPVAPGVEVGARVSLFPHPGAWSQWLTADADTVVAVPDELPDEIAAQMLINPLTAIMLRRAAEEHLAFGYNGLLVQTAAGSSVGRLMTGVCQFHNLPLINVVRDAAAQVTDPPGRDPGPLAVGGLRREADIRRRHREADRPGAQGPVRRGRHVQP
ncbi:alcohol dehydrogenase catalytic domain-containing protein [Streptomyces sp. NPDC048496]|uniref:alcohol dehydrogenase catalytic domain-containing protein n=1 Tax=Streptomyces sp. NPDC048496 TaxID=3365558 RepID=UPI00371BC488